MFTTVQALYYNSQGNAFSFLKGKILLHLRGVDHDWQSRTWLGDATGLTASKALCMAAMVACLSPLMRLMANTWSAGLAHSCNITTVIGVCCLVFVVQPLKPCLPHSFKDLVFPKVESENIPAMAAAAYKSALSQSKAYSCGSV